MNFHLKFRLPIQFIFLYPLNLLLIRKLTFYIVLHPTFNAYRRTDISYREAALVINI